MDELEETAVATVGERLREAREAQGLTLEAVAAQTRIPTRHLASLEAGEWSNLPAPTYSYGFAKNYAAVVGLDRNEIGEQLREEMGGMRAATHIPAEVFQPADPGRSMPKWLIVGAVLGVILVLAILSFVRNRSIEPAASAPVAETAPATTAAPAAPVAAPTGQVLITALEPVWLEVRDGANILKQGQLTPPESFEVPAAATAPMLKTGRPEALRISVGGRDVPAVGPAGRSVAHVSLLPTDLARGPSAASAEAAPSATTSRPAVTRASAPAPRAPAAASSAPASAPATPAPAASNAAAPTE